MQNQNLKKLVDATNSLQTKTEVISQHSLQTKNLCTDVLKRLRDLHDAENEHNLLKQELHDVQVACESAQADFEEKQQTLNQMKHILACTTSEFVAWKRELDDHVKQKVEQLEMERKILGLNLVRNTDGTLTWTFSNFPSSVPLKEASVQLKLENTPSKFTIISAIPHLDAEIVDRYNQMLQNPECLGDFLVQIRKVFIVH